jgi:molybdopterin molybdotransferase
MNMVSVEEALKIIHSKLQDFGTEEVHFTQVTGRVLDEDVTADRDFPPFHRAAMDGISISYADWVDGMRTFPVAGEQFAGAPQKSLERGTCLEIMTGAVVPIGADVVIRYEDITIEQGKAKVNVESIEQLQSIHQKSSDAEKGSVLIEKGKRLSHGDTGILTSVGKVNVLVKKLPRVAIISTGDELVEPDKSPLPHQIRKSNVYTLCSLLNKEHLNYEVFHIDDEENEIIRVLPEILHDFELVLLSGGVSKGKRDFIPESLEKHGIQKHFHRIKQRPGKPLWFGSGKTTTVFGFPGNPVSTIACYTVYCQDWLNRSLGIQSPESWAELTEDVQFEKDLTYFVHVSISNDNGMLKAKPLRGNGSGDLVSLSNADGFIELPAEQSEFKAGEKYQVHLF